MHCHKLITFATIGFLALAIVLGIVAVATNHWLELSADGGTNTADITIGPLKTCTDGGSCVAFSDTADQAACPNRTGAGYATRMLASIGLAGGGVVCAILAVLFGACCSTPKGRSKCLPTQLVLTFLAVAGTAASIGVFHLTLGNWWFCGVSYCEWLETHRSARAGTEVELGSCSSKFGYSFYLLILAALLLWVAMVLTIFKMCCCVGPRNEEKEYYAPQNTRSHSSGRAVSNAPYATEVTRTVPAAYAAGQTAPAGEPEGYAWDEESQLYWSDKDQLYWDLQSGQFYSAEAGQWYDAATDTWYTKDE